MVHESVTIGGVLEYLETLDESWTPPYGFNHPHCYRGYYDDCAVEPAKGVSVADMKRCLKDAIAEGAEFQGWKGGTYTFGEYTSIWLSEEGYSSGIALAPSFLQALWGKEVGCYKDV